MKDVFAHALTVEHIGETVSFDWQFPRSGVKARVTGQLLTIHHTVGGTTVEAKGKDAVTNDEFNLKHSTVVTVEVKA